MKFSLSSFAILILGVLNAHAQEPAPTTPAVAPTTPAPPGTVAAEGEGGDSPASVDFLQRSNFVISKINSSKRAMDPFGMMMDPTNTRETSALADQYEEVEETPVLNNSSLRNALEDLPITGVYPTRQTIVLGARSFQRGGQFGMKLDELTIRLRFEGIKGTEIFFKDLDTQEISSVNFNAKPEEFEPITAGTKASILEGIVPMTDLFIVN